MASPTRDRRVKVGTKIEGLSETFTVIKVLKHAYRIADKKFGGEFDLWSWEVSRNQLGQFTTDKF